MSAVLPPEQQTNETGFTAVPGEPEDEYIARVVAGAPLLTREQADRILPFLKERPGPAERQTA